jgi:tetratricopeptide (TPR) repeat protein/transcriptional regulator with XRE-family HTH domain
VAERPVLGFARLLRQLRAEAGLTQEELAEASGLSPRSVSDLERGAHRTARPDTARLLADALGLAEPVRALFVAAARGRRPAAEALAARQAEVRGAFAAAATRALPRDISNFTGRQAELARLFRTLAGIAADGAVVGINAIGGMAGVGKTTFAVHAAHRLAGSFPDGQFFLPLHAHTRGQRPVEPADALASLLLVAGIGAQAIPAGLEARAGCWRDYLAGKKVLLVLDDATGHEQVRPLLPGTAGSLVLITSRRRLTALEDAAVISLDTLPPGEAAELMVRLTGRPDIRPGDGGVAEIARLCGHLPLAIGMLARQLHHHPAWTPVGLAADLAAARDRLELMHAEDVSVAAAFDLSYQDLISDHQRLFRRLGLHPGPDIDAYAAAALDSTTLNAAGRGLDGLYDQHLLTEPAPGRYRLHDLLRAHAEALAASDDPADRGNATGRLLDYYLQTALAASNQIGSANWSPVAVYLPLARPPECAPPVSTPGQAAAWLDTERANLHASVGYAVANELPLYATLIPAAISDFLHVQGRWHEAMALQQTALAAARQAGDRPGQARAQNLLASMQIMTRDFAAAEATLQQTLALHGDLGDQGVQADALNGLGRVYWLTADYPAAVTCLQQSLDLFRDIGHRRTQARAIDHWRGQAQALNGLGAVQRLTGDYPSAAAYHQQALALFRDIGDLHGQSEALIHLSTIQRLTGDYPAAATSLRMGQALHRDLGDRYKQAWAGCELGVLQRLTGDYPAAAASTQQALKQYRDLGDRSGQAYVLNQLGLVQQLTGDYPAAAANHQKALSLYRDLGQRHEQAEVLNNLGEMSSRCAASQQAYHYYNQALTLARQVGAPLEEARALDGIGHRYLHDGHTREGTAHMRQALTIYHRIGAPAAQRVQDTLRQHGL